MVSIISVILILVMLTVPNVDIVQSMTELDQPGFPSVNLANIWIHLLHLDLADNDLAYECRKRSPLHNCLGVSLGSISRHQLISISMKKHCNLN